MSRISFLMLVFAGQSSTHAFVQLPRSSISSALFAHNDATNFENESLHQEVELFESILRDGEQGARRTLTPEQKGRFAFKLEQELGAKTIIDAGLPGASPLDFSGVQHVVSNTHQSILSTLAHGTPTEIAVAARALRGAEERSRISTFHRPMEVSTRYNASGGSSVRKRLLKQARRAVAVASDLAPEVQYYLVYAGNRDPKFLEELAHAVVDAGATHVVIGDSQSALTPSKAHKLTSGIREAVDGTTTIAIHCHNQMGLALPNTLAAIRAGATQVESCLVGIGDAGGNLATEQFLAYCKHSQSMARHGDDDDLFPSSCSVLGDSSPAASVALAKEVAQMMSFNIGENQPMLGERAFTCTTGIHQDNLDHLGHTTFQPKIVGREWNLALNRHSSRKAVQFFLSNHPELQNHEETKEDLADALYSYLSYQTEVMDEESLLSFCNQLLEAHAVLRNRGVVICPTTVGYTLITTRNALKMNSLKGRPDGKPCGILGTPEIYKSYFGEDPPLKSDQFEKHILGHLGRPVLEYALPKDAIGPKGEVGIWLECGPAIDYLASKFWSEFEEVIVATSCNMAGEGNPKSDKYGLEHIHSSVRTKVDFEISIPHWEAPDLDQEGRWLSAPIWDLEEKVFLRVGRNQKAVEGLLDEQRHSKGIVEDIPEIEIPHFNSTGALNSPRALGQ